VRYSRIVRASANGVLLACVALSCSRPPTTDAKPRVEGAAPKDAVEASAPRPSETSSLASAPPLPMPPEAPPTCEDVRAVQLFVSPATPWTGAPLRVLAVSDKPIAGELRIGEKGKDTVATSAERRGGPPYYYLAVVPAPRAGAHVVSIVQTACEAGQGVATLDVNVVKWRPQEPAAPKEGDGLWPIRRAWSHRMENLYSAWIEALFDAPDGEQPSWPALHEVLRDPKRNFFHDYLAAGEDSASAPVVRPDCADLPYFLRAYFAWKMRLPFGLSECNRGGGGSAPSCKTTLITNEEPPTRTAETAVKQFGTFLKGTLADKAHSGSARQPFEEENSDYYPVPLTWESLRPGTIYADPYGHVLMVAKKLPQNGERGGVLLAVDGQPDGTVARKRYWRGNFLYATQRELGGPGWKRFRPVMRRAGKLVRLEDEGIKRHPEYGDLSREAQKLDVDGFYDRMDEVLAPRPLDPHRAMMETLAALEEQVQTRVKSVDNGRKWLETAKSQASMPEGSEIFETSGAWEDYSTPSRDLRILIAIDVVRGFPGRVARRPERYAMPAGRTPKDVADELARTLDKELASRSITYTRSDGSPFKLTLAEVLSRSAALEVAYNPNECAEARWGAPTGSDEARTCTAHAPADQRARMETYRAWFHERRRPPRK
jgi:hypothetical protein